MAVLDGLGEVEQVQARVVEERVAADGREREAVLGEDRAPAPARLDGVQVDQQRRVLAVDVGRDALAAAVAHDRRVADEHRRAVRPVVQLLGEAVVPVLEAEQLQRLGRDHVEHLLGHAHAPPGRRPAAPLDGLLGLLRGVAGRLRGGVVRVDAVVQILRALLDVVAAGRPHARGALVAREEPVDAQDRRRLVLEGEHEVVGVRRQLPGGADDAEVRRWWCHGGEGRASSREGLTRAQGLRDVGDDDERRESHHHHAWVGQD